MNDEQNAGGDAPPAPGTNDTPSGDTSDDPTIGTAGGKLPAESLEKGAAASRYIDNPDKPDPTSVAQIEVLPDELAGDTPDE